MKLKRMSIRFNLEQEADRRAWEHLQCIKTSRNQAVIAAINASFEPVNQSLTNAIRETIRECLQNISASQVPLPEQASAISEEESALLDSLDDLMGS